MTLHTSWDEESTLLVPDTRRRDKATTLNGQFQSVFTRDESSKIPTIQGDKYPTIKEFIITEEGVRKLLANVNPSKSSGPDNIPCTILKELATELAPIVTCIFNQSLHTGTLPQDWLSANVAPIYKKSNRHKAENYRHKPVRRSH